MSIPHHAKCSASFGSCTLYTMQKAPYHHTHGSAWSKLCIKKRLYLESFTKTSLSQTRWKRKRDKIFWSRGFGQIESNQGRTCRCTASPELSCDKRFNLKHREFVTDTSRGNVYAIHLRRAWLTLPWPCYPLREHSYRRPLHAGWWCQALPPTGTCSHDKISKLHHTVALTIPLHEKRGVATCLLCFHKPKVVYVICPPTYTLPAAFNFQST